MDSHRFTYDAIIEDIYDGDSCTLSIDLGFGLWARGQKMRLYGIDTPEVRGPERPEGLKSRDWLREQLPVGSAVVIRSHLDRTGKFGRYLCQIYKDGVNLNDRLVELGLAEVNYYGDRSKSCDT